MVSQKLLIKVGGGEKINWHYIAKDLGGIPNKEKVVIVHGANAIRDEIAKKMGVPTKIITSPSGVSSVFTDSRALDIFLMSYAGIVNKHIVSLLQKSGLNAVGLSGVDGRLWQAKRKQHVFSVENGKTKLIINNLTGRVEEINVKLINILLKNDFLPVICPPAIDENSQIVNIDGDIAAVKTAVALGIKEIVFLFESSGLLRRYPDEKSLIKKVEKDNIDKYLPIVVGRMKKKILAVKKAFDLGIRIVYFGDGRYENPITNILAGKGTVIS